MADPVTPNVQLAVPTRGSDPGTWDIPINGDMITADGYFGGVQSISVSNAPLTLTGPAGVSSPSGGPTQAQNAVLRFLGTLTTNVQVTLPLPGVYVVENMTTGAFVLSFRAVATGQVIATEQGSAQRIYCDGTNVKFVSLPPVGSYLDVCDATVPAWINACTVPPYLNCDGNSFSSTTYPYLFSKIGAALTPDLRGRARFANDQGTGRITTAGSGIDGSSRFSAGGGQNYTLPFSALPNGRIGVNVSGTVNQTNNGTGGYFTLFTSNAIPNFGFGTGGSFGALIGAGGNLVSFPGVISSGSMTGLTDSINGGVAQTPTVVMPPTFISGLTLIRAA